MTNKFIPKCVTISIEQNKFLGEPEQEDFKLSKFLQEKLWDYMKLRDVKKDFVKICDKEVEYG